ncbi:MAG: CPBP family intramembrane metalloprotease [Candidatus Eremiobacteraeota bacterium]|nr:CPBP family intramembrane metalloprotease [Candidatus Eremiobacteraeota bacterium]
MRKEKALTALTLWLGLVWVVTVGLRLAHSASTEATVAAKVETRLAERLAGVSFHFPSLSEETRSKLLEAAREMVGDDPLKQKILRSEEPSPEEMEKLEGWYFLQGDYIRNHEKRTKRELEAIARSDLNRLMMALALILASLLTGSILWLLTPRLFPLLGPALEVEPDRERLCLALSLYFLWDFLCLMMGPTVKSLLDPFFKWPIVVVPVQFVFYLLGLGLCFSFCKELRMGVTWKNTLAGVCAFTMCGPVVFLATQLTQLLSGRSAGSTNPMLEMLTNVSTGVFWLVLLAAVVGPMFEEFLFRGVIYGNLRRALPVGPAMAVSAFIFALVHGDFMAILPLAGLGAMFAALYEKTGSLWPSMVCHALWNGATVWMLWLLF